MFLNQILGLYMWNVWLWILGPQRSGRCTDQRLRMLRIRWSGAHWLRTHCLRTHGLWYRQCRSVSQRTTGSCGLSDTQETQAARKCLKTGPQAAPSQDTWDTKAEPFQWSIQYPQRDVAATLCRDPLHCWDISWVLSCLLPWLCRTHLSYLVLLACLLKQPKLHKTFSCLLRRPGLCR